MMRTYFPLAGKRHPTQAQLDALFAAADGFELRRRDGAGRDRALVYAGDAAALAELQRALRLREDPQLGFHCMCHGDLGLILTRRGRRTEVLGLHHGQGLRHPSWSSDADLLAPRDFAAFLEQHGCPGALAAYDASAAAARESLQQRDAFAAAAPPALATFARGLSPAAPPPPKQGLDGPIAALVDSLGGDRAAARRELLRWAGVSRSPWDVYPAYEIVPIDMLARMELDRNLAGPLASDDDRELFGLCRYIALRGLSVAGTDALHDLSDEKRQRLLALAAPYDGRGRLAERLDPQVLVHRIPDGATLEHLFEESNSYGLCTDGERFFGIDGRFVVRFDPGERRPRRLCEVSRDERILVAASGRGLVVADGRRLFTLSIDGVRGELLTLAQPPDALGASSAHILWVTNSDPTNPDGRTHALCSCGWDDAQVRTLIPESPSAPYSLTCIEGRWFVVQRRTMAGFLGLRRQRLAILEIAPGPGDAAVRVFADLGSAELSNVYLATSPIPAETHGEEPPALFVAVGKEVRRYPLDGSRRRPERIGLDVEPRRLAATAHGPLFMVDCGDHLRIEQRTVWRAPRYVLDLPRLPWPSVLIGRGDWLYIGVGPAVLRTRI